MRLTTLGGSAAGPNPGQGCSGYLIESGPTQVVIDLGPGTLPELRKHVDFREIDAIVLSHLHLDHMLDVLALRYALAYNPIAPRRPLPLWLPPGGLEFFDRLATAITGPSDEDSFFAVFDSREYDPEQQLTIDGISIQFHPTVHYVPCWAMRVSNGVDGDLFYTADTGPSAPLAQFARGSYVVIAEGTERGVPNAPYKSRGHLTPREAGNLARDADAEVLVLSHLWGEEDPFSAIREAEAAFHGPVELATPGLRLAWTTAGD
jgi:ribonuclease BN (tRNA processing enzyme)